jgi:DNA-binding MarR family transcriptional regulator
MLRVTKLTDYATVVLTVLANEAERVHSAAELAERSRVEPATVAKVLKLLAQAGLTVQPRAPLTAIVKLVFGSDYDKTRLAEYAAVLAYARRTEVPAGGLTTVLETAQGGIKAVVAAERATRRPDERVDLFDRAAAELRALPVLGRVALPEVADEFIVLLARAGEDGLVDVIKCVDDKALLESVLRKAAA